MLSFASYFQNGLFEFEYISHYLMISPNYFQDSLNQSTKCWICRICESIVIPHSILIMLCFCRKPFLNLSVQWTTFYYFLLLITQVVEKCKDIFFLNIDYHAKWACKYTPTSITFKWKNITKTLNDFNTRTYKLHLLCQACFVSSVSSLLQPGHGRYFLPRCFKCQNHQMLLYVHHFVLYSFIYRKDSEINLKMEQGKVAWKFRLKQEKELSLLPQYRKY